MERSSKPFEKRLEELTLDDRVFTILALAEPPVDLSKDKDYKPFLKARNRKKGPLRSKTYRQALGAIYHDVKGEFHTKFKLPPSYYKEFFDVITPSTVFVLKCGKDSIGDLSKKIYPILTPSEKLLLALGKGITNRPPTPPIDEIRTDEFENILLYYMVRGIYYLKRFEGIELKETDRILKDAERLANDGKPREINNPLFQDYKKYLRRH